MRRIATSLMFVAAAAAACSGTPDPEGPKQPVSRQVIALDDFRIAGQARSVAHAFLRAYADAPGDGGRTLEPLVDGVLAREWAHWVSIQNAGFPGSIDGSLQLGHLGTALPVRAPDGSLDDLVAYGVEVRATITFDLTDEDGDAASLQRLMDGLVVLVQGEDGSFRVINFVRDGLRLDQFFQVFDGAEERRDGVTVEIRNLIQLERWQFGVEIRNRSDRPMHVVRDLTALLTAAGEPAIREAPVIAFPGEIAPGETVEGIVSFAAPTTDEALDLQIAIAGAGSEASPFVFGVPQPASATSPSPTPAA